MQCPDCESELDESRNVLREDEWTTELSCPSCEFSLESMSNLAWRDRPAIREADV